MIYSQIVTVFKLSSLLVLSLFQNLNYAHCDVELQFFLDTLFKTPIGAHVLLDARLVFKRFLITVFQYIDASQLTVGLAG